MADRIGRRPLLMAAAGFGVGGTLPVDYMMMAEFLPSDRRGR